MPLALRNLHTVHDRGSYVLEQDVDIPLPNTKEGFPGDPLLVRANLYRPKKAGRFPVICTYGPYGKDIPYRDFHPASFEQVPSAQKSIDSAWETPDPHYWTSEDYAVLRVDERGLGNSPGFLDTMSRDTCDAFADVIEWASVQPWSTGKVGLLGISYYAGTQWRVAARKPKGLAAIIPWEGMSDYYRDRVRHGGILSNVFIKWWYDRQVGSNQYGLPGRTEKNWGKDSSEGILTPEELAGHRAEQPIDTAKYKFLDEEYYRSRAFDLSEIDVPILSVANWGGILLHLRGNVMGYMGAGSRQKFLRFITGRHDLPFYYTQEVEVQKSFLDAFLKDFDEMGWSTGKVPPVSLCIRKGDPGFNDAEAERRAFTRREEMAWPLPGTKYTTWHLSMDRLLVKEPATNPSQAGCIQYEAPRGDVSFVTSPFGRETEITGHPTARLSISLEERDGSSPFEIDIFVTLRHLDATGKEIFYTGTVGDPVPVVKGWQRVSLRATAPTPPHLSAANGVVPFRSYASTDVQPVNCGEIYTVDIEIWPTNVVLATGDTLVLQISSSDSQGCGSFVHNHPEDRAPEKLSGWNVLHIGPSHENWLRLPVVPGCR